MYLLFGVIKLNFQQPILLSSVSHDPSEIILISWFGAQAAFFIINVKHMVLWKPSYILGI